MRHAVWNLSRLQDFSLPLAPRDTGPLGHKGGGADASSAHAIALPPDSCGGWNRRLAVLDFIEEIVEGCTMTKQTQSILDEAVKLPATEKFVLVEGILTSLAEPDDDWNRRGGKKPLPVWLSTPPGKLKPLTQMRFLRICNPVFSEVAFSSAGTGGIACRNCLLQSNQFGAGPVIYERSS